MPSPNIVKEYLPHSYYHVYNRGVNKQPIFLKNTDYLHFKELLRRYLGLQGKRTRYPNFNQEIELAAYCLMPNHFHFLFYQYSEDAMQKLMQCLMTAYSLYFNKKHGRVGNLFQDRYKASLIDSDTYLLHISRYIHLNPIVLMKDDYRRYSYSSYVYYQCNGGSSWLKPGKIMQKFKSGADYERFVQSYEDIFINKL